jgi:hypothetical protein
LLHSFLLLFAAIFFLINGWINAKKNIFQKDESVKGRAFFLNYAFFQMFFSTDIQIYLNLLFQLYYYRLVFTNVKEWLWVWMWRGGGIKKYNIASFFFFNLQIPRVYGQNKLPENAK